MCLRICVRVCVEARVLRWCVGGGQHTDALTRRRGSGRTAASDLSYRVFFRGDLTEFTFALKN